MVWNASMEVISTICPGRVAMNFTEAARSQPDKATQELAEHVHVQPRQPVKNRPDPRRADLN